MVFRNVPLGDAAEWTRKTLRALGTQAFRNDALLRASCGLLSCSDEQEDGANLLKEADALLYQAKAAKSSGESGLMMSGSALERVS